MRNDLGTRDGHGLFEIEPAGKKQPRGRPAAGTKPGEDAFRRREAIVAPVFCQIMTCQNSRRLLPRGEDGARGERRLLAACRNFREAIRHAGTTGLAAAIA